MHNQHCVQKEVQITKQIALKVSVLMYQILNENAHMYESFIGQSSRVDISSRLVNCNETPPLDKTKG